MKNPREEEKKKKEKGSSNATSNLESRFNQTLRSVQELLLGSSFPGKVSLTRKSEPSSELTSPVRQQNFERSYSENDMGQSKRANNSSEEELQSSGNRIKSAEFQKLKITMTNSESKLSDALRSASGARAVDSARITKFTKALSGSSVILDSRGRLLTRKRLEYVDCASQYYDIPETERSDDEINMLRQIAVDCPRTVPDVTFFQQEQVQKSLERILYTWAIRHPASGYVQGINDLVTPFLMVFLSEHLDGGMESWSVSDLSPQKISNVEADCYWCLSKLLDSMQDHYTFAQPGIQRLIFKLKELVHRIDERVSRHMEEEGLEFLQFAFRWLNCLLIREIPFHLVTRLWDTYLAEGDALPDFLVYICASLLLTWSDELLKLDFQEMVMFLQHLPTQNWTHHELEMVLSRAYMWHVMFNNSPRHLAS
ncbi:TBC1 domain family member 22B-like isoform X2 [Phoenix dactylifera]|uniref:TBC1 domain family member 22B-like isoform X2 n=1 Tax=Phoenix dactylifera TaxID=42345 RepID=A0A8B7CJP7_PHODC|nr:TBC1 domain family member 22B-like isoform X2 [Phoenix dactylifera]